MDLNIKKLLGQLTRQQIKIIYIAILIVVFISCFLLFVYFPRNHEVKLIKTEINLIENQINEISKIAGGDNLAISVSNLRDELNRLQGRLPSQEEVVVKNLSEEARKLNIEIKNIVFSGNNVSSRKIGESNIEEMLLVVDLSCEFKSLGEYLCVLRNDFPVLVKVKKFTIKGHGPGRMKLDISLSIVAYLLKDS